MNKLAIIIPAYKIDFFETTLISIANQTNKSFKLFICDDCSPYQIEKNVNLILRNSNIQWSYFRFNKNFGGTNLINQWNRCLSLVENEEYVWLFSDDDIMDIHCVEKFYETIEILPNYDVYHFNLDIIDKNDKLLRHCPDYSDVMDINDFFSSLYMGRIEARMPEFIFRKSSLERNEGFVNYDLAWRSDNASVILNAADKGIRTIKGANVLWRDSSNNISGNLNKEILIRKDNSTIRFFNYVDQLFKDKKLNYKIDMLRLIRSYAYCLSQIKGRHPLKIYWGMAKKYSYLDSIIKKIIFVFWCYKNK